MSQESTQNKSESDIQRKVDAGELEGASHLVVQGAEQLKCEFAGWCDVEDKKLFGEKTIVRIYSMSKPITSVAAMTLWEQGKFQLDDPVSQFIPAFSEMRVVEKTDDGPRLVPPKRPMTVRDVFRHTTGYSYGDDPLVREYHDKEKLRYRGISGMFVPRMSIEKGAEALARIPAIHHPGERFTYGFSTDLLGRLIEVWSGQSLDAYLQESVFNPLEMVDTGFRVTDDKRDRFASCHSTWQDRLVIIDKAAKSPYCDGFEFLSGGGGLVSTQGDYSRFCSMLVHQGSYQGKQILKPETLALMFEDQLKGIAGPFRFGLGFSINEISIGQGEQKRKAMEYGWGGYASTDFRVVPSEKVYQIFLRQHIPSSHDFGIHQISEAYKLVK